MGNNDKIAEDAKEFLFVIFVHPCNLHVFSISIPSKIIEIVIRAQSEA